MWNDGSLQSQLSHSITRFFKKALMMQLRSPFHFMRAAHFLAAQCQAARIRAKHNQNNGIHVPPFLIFSVTNTCNLNCKGCYANAHAASRGSELSDGEMVRILGQAQELGIATVIIAGGEPFMRNDLLKIVAEFPKMLFIVFTNGILLTEELIQAIQKYRNLIPVVSLEGYQKNTDERRGAGVYRHVKDALVKMKQNKVIFGVSLTVTTKNISLITEVSFVQDILENGADILFYIDYVPFEQGTENLELTKETRMTLKNRLSELQNKFKALFVSFPGDESQYGGCLSSGRGFFHIASDGSIEPCPFAPFSKENARETLLADALKSKFFQNIRDHHELLNEEDGGCALFKNQEWLKQQL